MVFARWPTLGSGKQRLGKDIGAVEALRFQRSTLALMLRRLGADRRWITWLHSSRKMMPGFRIYGDYGYDYNSCYVLTPYGYQWVCGNYGYY